MVLFTTDFNFNIGLDFLITVPCRAAIFIFSSKAPGWEVAETPDHCGNREWGSCGRSTASGPRVFYRATHHWQRGKRGRVVAVGYGVWLAECLTDRLAHWQAGWLSICGHAVLSLFASLLPGCMWWQAAAGHGGETGESGSSTRQRQAGKHWRASIHLRSRYTPCRQCDSCAPTVERGDGQSEPKQDQDQEQEQGGRQDWEQGGARGAMRESFCQTHRNAAGRSELFHLFAHSI